MINKPTTNITNNNNSYINYGNSYSIMIDKYNHIANDFESLNFMEMSSVHNNLDIFIQNTLQSKFNSQNINSANTKATGHLVKNYNFGSTKCFKKAHELASNQTAKPKNGPKTSKTSSIFKGNHKAKQTSIKNLQNKKDSKQKHLNLKNDIDSNCTNGRMIKKFAESNSDRKSSVNTLDHNNSGIYYQREGSLPNTNQIPKNSKSGLVMIKPQYPNKALERFWHLKENFKCNDKFIENPNGQDPKISEEELGIVDSLTTDRATTDRSKLDALKKKICEKNSSGGNRKILFDEYLKAGQNDKKRNQQISSKRSELRKDVTFSNGFYKPIDKSGTYYKAWKMNMGSSKRNNQENQHQLNDLMLRSWRHESTQNSFESEEFVDPLENPAFGVESNSER